MITDRCSTVTTIANNARGYPLSDFWVKTTELQCSYVVMGMDIDKAGRD
ncbi:hypothetical protein GCM10027562_28350 [Arthrobacter pigmenti]